MTENTEKGNAIIGSWRIFENLMKIIHRKNEMRKKLGICLSDDSIQFNQTFIVRQAWVWTIFLEGFSTRASLNQGCQGNTADYSTLGCMTAEEVMNKWT